MEEEEGEEAGEEGERERRSSNPFPNSTVVPRTDGVYLNLYFYHGNIFQRIEAELSCSISSHWTTRQLIVQPVEPGSGRRGLDRAYVWEL